MKLNFIVANSYNSELIVQNLPENETTETGQTKSKQPNIPVPREVEIKTRQGENPRDLHRRCLMEAASEAGIDGTDQQKEFVDRWIKSGISFSTKESDPSPENGLNVRSEDLKGEWQAYKLSADEITDLKRLQKEYVAQGGVLTRGKTYENSPEGESFSMARRGATGKKPLTDAQYEAQKLRALWERAQIPESSIFGTPSKLKDLKHISINVPPDTTAEQSDRILAAYIEQRYGDRTNLWGSDKADILQIAKSKGVKIENVKAADGKAEFDMSVENLLKLHIAYIGVQEKANILEAKVKDLQWNSSYNQFLVGIGEGAWNNLKGIGETAEGIGSFGKKLFNDPIGTAQGIFESAKSAGSIALELAQLPAEEKAKLFEQLAKAGLKGLAEMPPNVAARHLGNFIGSLAVDALLGKGIGTAIGLLKGLKIGAKIITETVELSKKLKQTLGKIPVPTLESKILDLGEGGKITFPGLEIKKLEDLIKPLESRTSRIYSGEITDIPQGFSKIEFQKFARSVRQLSKAAGLPEGELVVQGSRISGTARISGRNLSDVDLALRVDEKTFFNFAQARLDSVPKDSKLYKTLLKAARKGKLSRFDISPEFNKLLQKMLKPNSPYDVDFSIIKVGSQYDTGPFLKIGDVE